MFVVNRRAAEEDKVRKERGDEERGEEGEEGAEEGEEEEEDDEDEKEEEDVTVGADPMAETAGAAAATINPRAGTLARGVILCGRCHVVLPRGTLLDPLPNAVVRMLDCQMLQAHLGLVPQAHWAFIAGLGAFRASNS